VGWWGWRGRWRTGTHRGNLETGEAERKRGWWNSLGEINIISNSIKRGGGWWGDIIELQHKPNYPKAFHRSPCFYKD